MKATLSTLAILIYFLAVGLLHGTVIFSDTFTGAGLLSEPNVFFLRGHHHSQVHLLYSVPE